MTSINHVCPRCRRPVVPEALTRYRGLVVGFCSQACRDAFEARDAGSGHEALWFDALIAERGLDREGELPTLEGARLRLRWLRADDVPALYAVFSDAEVLRYWSHGPFTDPAQAQDYLESIRLCFREGTLWQWGVARREDDAVIGTVTLSRIDTTHRRAEIGYALARAHWGRGLGREAVALALSHAFGALGLARVGADVDPDNGASLRLLEALGFRREGYLRESWRVGGGVQDSVLLGLLAREWNPDTAHGAGALADGVAAR